MLCDTRHINLYPVGLEPVPKSLMHLRGQKGGSKEDGTLLSIGVLSHADDRPHIHLGISNVPFPSDYQIFRMAPSGTRPVSR